MGTVSKTYTFSSGAIIVAAEHNTNFDNLYNVVNGNLDSNNLSSSANIASTQLATITAAGKVNTSALVTTSQAAGDILYNDGTGWVRLSKDAGKCLISGASAVSWGFPAGTIVQVVNTQTSAYATGATFITVDDSKPQITEGTEVMTLAITPASATNKLKITVCVNGSVDFNGRLVCALFQDATADALAAASGQQLNNNNILQNVTFIYYMAAGTTSATTFKVRIGADTTGHNVYLNGQSGARIFGGVLYSSITIEEIKV